MDIKDILTPEELERLKRAAEEFGARMASSMTPEEKWRAQQAMGIDVGGFLSIVVDRLLKEPPPPTEPYTPPAEDVPPSLYIPLAHR
jgi:hypothetical protein